MTRWLDEGAHGKEQPLGECGSITEPVHVFDRTEINAVNAALASRRPLLVRGEPGTGKSQLARAAAVAMNRPFLCHVVDSRTTAEDLLWKFDAVGRLAEAQLAGALRETNAGKLREQLEPKRFVTPGRLWWALDWGSAATHVTDYGGPVPAAPADWIREESPVILIDEIDKADSDVPNGLLEVLGSRRFQPHGYDQEICCRDKNPPLVVITTNEERALPDAFLRRCMVLHIELPNDGEALKRLLVVRGKAHFDECSDDVLQLAAEQLVKDRAAMKQRRLPAPGQAEYLDLIRAVTEMRPKDVEAQRRLLEQVALYALQKHPRDATR